MRRIGKWVALALLMLLSVELSARVAEWILPHRAEGAGPEFGANGDVLPAGFEWMSDEIVHPFVGYTHGWDGVTGVPSPISSVAAAKHRRNGIVNIAVVGGSVANFASSEIEATFDRAYADGRMRARPDVFHLAHPGFKQPQQLNVISWFLSLGAEYDVVINVDGYNEVALSIGENYPAGVHPLFPRRWDQRVSHIPSSARLREIGRITFFQELARALTPSPSSLLGSSATGRLATRTIQALARKQVALGRESLRTIPVRADLEAKGPFREYRRPENLRRRVIDHWAQSSRLLDHLVSAQSGEYHHFLQPNQYLPGSKTLTAEERATAYSPEFEQAAIAERAFPDLRASGAELKSEGVRFHDATQIYADVTETIYNDTCCHVNQRGDDLLAQFIVDQVLATTELEALQPRNEPSGKRPDASTPSPRGPTAE